MKADSSQTSFPSDQSVCSVQVYRFNVDGQTTQRVSDQVIAERAVTVMIDKVGSFTIMCTPLDLKALAVGFVYGEGMIDSMDDVIEILATTQKPEVVGIKVRDPARISVGRNLIVASSCGMCGARNIEKMLAETPLTKTSLKLSGQVLLKVAQQLQAQQQFFELTGGSHAAAIFDARGQIIALAEDIGRHVALDKAIGKCLLENRPMKQCGVALSGRVSWEMVAKTARAGIELITAISAPSSLAISSAQQWNITLCGFVRPPRLSIYTHPQRITDLHHQTITAANRQSC